MVVHCLIEQFLPILAARLTTIAMGWPRLSPISISAPGMISTPNFLVSDLFMRLPYDLSARLLFPYKY